MIRLLQKIKFRRCKIYRRKVRHLTYNTSIICPVCDGAGVVKHCEGEDEKKIIIKTCNYCHGTGLSDNVF